MRKTQKKKTIDWQRLASDLAEDMHENNFSSHYGWGRFPKGFYYYNNHPTQSREETLLPSIRRGSKSGRSLPRWPSPRTTSNRTPAATRSR